MRTIAAGLAGLLLAAPVFAQGGPITQHWPQSRISFPMNQDKINALKERPVSVRFYAAPERGKFALKHDKKPADFDEIVDPSGVPKRGFVYDAMADGVEEFAVQYVFADGSVSPPTTRLEPTYRVHFDTRPPVVKASAISGNSIRWKADDDNLLPGGVKLEGRLLGKTETDWQTLKTGRELGADDTYRWPKIPDGSTLEVRVYATDRAGHESRSAPIKLTGGDGKVDGPKWDNDPPKAPKPGGAFGDTPKRDPRGFGGDELPGGGGPKQEFVCSKKLTVKTKVTHITRSGVTAAQLYVQTPNAAGEWKPATKKEGLNLTTESADADRVVAIDYDAPEDGLYGFIVQPISGAGTKQDDPRTGDTPQFLVRVDTTAPKLSLKHVGVVQQGFNGPILEILWETEDANFPAEPILLEYSVDGKEWKLIGKSATPNGGTGKYTWEITDKKLWKFQVRAQASDIPGNTTLVTYTGDNKQPQWVMVDLEKPSGSVDKVNGTGAPLRTEGGPGGKPIGVEPRIEGAGGTAPAPLPNVIRPADNPTPPKPDPKPTPPPIPPPAPPKVEDKKPDPPKPDKPLVVPEPPKVPGGLEPPPLPDKPPPKPDAPKPGDPKKEEPKKPETPKKIDADVELPPLPPPVIPPVPLPEPPK